MREGRVVGMRGGNGVQEWVTHGPGNAIINGSISGVRKRVANGLWNTKEIDGGTSKRASNGWRMDVGWDEMSRGVRKGQRLGMRNGLTPHRAMDDTASAALLGAVRECLRNEVRCGSIMALEWDE